MSLRAAVIAILVLLMLIPLGMVSSIISERSYRHQGVLNEIANAWGQEQTLSGPVLGIPFTESIVVTESIKDENGNPVERKKTRESKHTAYFLPHDLQINSSLQEELRSRGIFDSVVYKGEIELVATFGSLDLTSLSGQISGVHWDKAFVSVGISDTRAINDVERFEWNGLDSALSPGTQIRALPSGFHAKLSQGNKGPAISDLVNESGNNELRMRLSINGSGGFHFTPHGERTRVSIQSTWPHPSFQGGTLPTERAISEDGFTASWDISHLSRNYAQQWTDHQSEIDLFELSTGVRIFEPDSLYTRITRASKYGVLFIGLTFLTLLIFELSIRQRVHLLQYALIGVSLSMFYLVLLSLSEHIGFIKAYAIATLICTTMISVYTGSVVKSAARGFFVALLLTGLYALLYSLIRLEDYALLMGTLVLLLVVIVLMRVTRDLGGPASDNPAPHNPVPDNRYPVANTQ